MQLAAQPRLHRRQRARRAAVSAAQDVAHVHRPGAQRRAALRRHDAEGVLGAIVAGGGGGRRARVVRVAAWLCAGRIAAAVAAGSPELQRYPRERCALRRGAVVAIAEVAEIFDEGKKKGAGPVVIGLAKLVAYRFGKEDAVLYAFIQQPYVVYVARMDASD